MKINLLKMVLWMSILMVGCHSLALSAVERNKFQVKCLAPQNSQNFSGFVFLDSLDDVFFDQGEIMLNAGGLAHAVNSLQKVEGRWLAGVSIKGYCPRGHPLCKNCGLCHKKDCYYYVPPCKLWD